MNVPAGNATGVGFQGVYVLDSSMITGCRCRTGSCSKWHGDSGVTFKLTETDGALHVVEHAPTNDVIYDGGIDINGAFRLGGTYVSGKQTAFSFLSGTVHAGVAMDAESELTFVGPIDGDSYDCDVAGVSHSSYLTQP